MKLALPSAHQPHLGTIILKEGKWLLQQANKDRRISRKLATRLLSSGNYGTIFEY